jgi:hypothetical protein
MKSDQFAIVEIDPLLGGTPDDELYNGSATATFPRWTTLVELLRESGVRTVSGLGLLCGGIAWNGPKAVLLLLRNPDEAVAASVARSLGDGLCGVVWSVASDRAHAGWSHLLGAGVVCASAGISGRPLVGLGVGELRQELAESRKALHDVLGYAPSICSPRPNTAGTAVDGLVEREAHRAGYEMILEPGRGLEVPETTRISVWSPASGSSPKAVAGWIEGDSWLRISFELRRQRERWFA